MKEKLQLEAVGTKSSMIVYAVSIATDADAGISNFKAAVMVFLVTDQLGFCLEIANVTDGKRI